MVGGWTTVCGGLTFAEGPRWRDGRLWFSDFFDHAVKSVSAAGDVRVEVQLDGDRPSGLGWLPDGRLLLVSMERRLLLRREPDGSLVVHGDLSGIATFHCNDMVVDALGRAYVGNFGFDLDGMNARAASGDLEGAKAMFRDAAIARVDPDGTVAVAAEGLQFPNGTVVTPDGRTLIVAESRGRCLRAFDVAPDGTLSGGRVWAEIDGAPDGICLDAEGLVWVADARGRRVVRVAEGRGIVEQLVTDDGCFACMLGGDDGRTLFALLAPTSEPTAAAAARAGRIVATTVRVPHAGLP